MLLFEIHAPPTPQRPTRFFRRGNSIGTYNPCLKERQQIQWQIKPYAPKEPLTGAVCLDITFFMPIPKGTSSVKKRQMLNGVILPTKRPDIDNLAYLVTNALKEIVYADDSQIVDQILRKRYGETPKTVIKVIPMDLISNYEVDNAIS